jgi:hypothetical protein
MARVNATFVETTRRTAADASGILKFIDFVIEPGPVSGQDTFAEGVLFR